MTSHTRNWSIAVLLTAALGGALLLWWQRSAAPAVGFRTAMVERGSIEASVSAAGELKPVVQVQVGSQVSGQISELGADFNSEVKAGQLIARIDPATFEYRLRQAEADLDAARAGLLSAQASALSAQAQATRAEVELRNAQADLSRKQELLNRQFISPAEVDNARLAVQGQEQGLASARALGGVARAQVAMAQANIKQREAQRAQAQVDLERTQIRSPVDGVVISRSVQLGQTVAASLQAPELFVIAQNLREMQVEVAIDEADVGRVQAGQGASFTVDAFPAERFHGAVEQVRKAAVSTSNVVTYTVVVSFDNASGRLLPGMTANVRIITDTREDVFKVPNAALRVRMPEGVAVMVAGATDAAPGASRGAAGTGLLNGANGGTPAGVRGPGGRGGAGGGARPTASGQIYLLDARAQPVAVPVRLGLTDGLMTEVRVPEHLSGELRQGREVVVGVTGAAAASRASGPRMMF